MGKIVKAIVRGPENYFDGELHPPGDIVEVDEDFVSEEDFIEKEIDVTLPTPIVGPDGRLQRNFKEVVKAPVRFRPLGSAPTVTGHVGAAEMASGNIDRLDVNDFLKGDADTIVSTIVNGNVDDHLGAIEQGELSRKGPARKAVTEAISARLAAIHR